MGSTGEYLRVLENGEYWRVQVPGSEKYWRVLESTGEYWRMRVPGSEEYWRLLRVLETTGVVVKRTREYLRVLESTR